MSWEIIYFVTGQSQYQQATGTSIEHFQQTLEGLQHERKTIISARFKLGGL